MSAYLWPSEDGWPYPDTVAEWADDGSALDDDLFELQLRSPQLLSALDPLERQVITARYGLNGQTGRSMKELHRDLGLSRQELRSALGSGLAKLRTQLTV